MIFGERKVLEERQITKATEFLFGIGKKVRFVGIFVGRRTKERDRTISMCLTINS